MPGAGSENAGGISSRSCGGSTVAVTRRIRGLQGRTQEPAGDGTENEVDGPGAESAIFPHSITGTGADHGLAGAPNRQFSGDFPNFRAHFRFSDELPQLFRRPSMSDVGT